MIDQRNMIRHIQANYLFKMNQLQALQAQVSYWEKNKENYAKSIEVFKAYVDFVRTFNDPRALINSYIRMAQYCERMEDRLMATDLYTKAVEVMMSTGLGMQTPQFQHLRAKIESLHYF